MLIVEDIFFVQCAYARVVAHGKKNKGKNFLKAIPKYYVRNMRTEKFSCPNCKSKLPFAYVFKIANGHEFECPSCSTLLKPLNSKTWTWGAIIGFIGVVIPAQLYLYLHDNIVIALLIGVVTGATSVFAVALYVYLKTYLSKS